MRPTRLELVTSPIQGTAALPLDLVLRSHSMVFKNLDSQVRGAALSIKAYETVGRGKETENQGKQIES